MKKTILIILVCLFVVASLAARTKAYTQKVTAVGSVLPNLQFPDVTATSTQTQAGYVVSAWVTARPGEVISTLTHAPLQIRLYKFGNGGTVPYDTRIFVQFGSFPTDWTGGAGGETLHVQIINNNVTPAIQGSYDIAIATNLTAAWTVTDPAQSFNLWPPSNTWAYNLQFTVPAGAYTINGVGAPYLFTDAAGEPNTLIGSYTISAAPAGFHWVVNPIVVAAGDFVTSSPLPNLVANAGKVFELAADADTYAFHLMLAGPAGTAITGPFSGTLPYEPTQPAGVSAVNSLLGAYTAAAAPAGFHWVVNPIVVVAGDFTLAKSFFDYYAMKTFVLAADVEICDYPTGVPTVVAPGITILVVAAAGVVGDGANVVAAPLVFPALPGGASANLPIYTETLQMVGVGPWTISYATLAPIGAWYSYVTHSWTIVHAVGGVVTFVIPAGGKDIPEVPIILGDETLPVELSSFAATLTAQNFVKLTWVTETETNLSGYRVYRNDSPDQATAVVISSSLIEPTNTSQTSTYTHIDNEVTKETTYSYWLEVVEMDGTTTFHGPTNVYVTAPTEVVPSLVTNMGNAYPNPFKVNTTTNIAYEVKAGEAGTITIYNIIGQIVKTVPVTETTSPKTFSWNGRDSKGNACSSGIYFYKLSTPSRNVTKKMVIVN